MYSRTKMFFIFFTLLILLLVLQVKAQTPPGPGDCPCDPDDPDYDLCTALHPECDNPNAAIPIDTNISWLIIAGVAMGFYFTSKYTTKT